MIPVYNVVHVIKSFNLWNFINILKVLRIPGCWYWSIKNSLEIFPGFIDQKEPFSAFSKPLSRRIWKLLCVVMCSPLVLKWSGRSLYCYTGFFCHRSASPNNGFMILNRLGLNNQIEPITKDLEFQLQDPFLLYRNSKGQCRKSSTLHQKILAYVKVGFLFQGKKHLPWQLCKQYFTSYLTYHYRIIHQTFFNIYMWCKSYLINNNFMVEVMFCTCWENWRGNTSNTKYTLQV